MSRETAVAVATAGAVLPALREFGVREALAQMEWHVAIPAREQALDGVHLRLVVQASNPSHPDAYRVLKMKHPKASDPAAGGKVEDRARILSNDWIIVENIPDRAYGYELGSRSAIGCVMESWRVRTNKASGIVNDPNDWGHRARRPYVRP